MWVKQIRWGTAGRRATEMELWLYKKGAIVWPLGQIHDGSSLGVLKPPWWKQGLAWEGRGWHVREVVGRQVWDIPTYIGGAHLSLHEDFGTLALELPAPIVEVPSVEADEIRGYVSGPGSEGGFLQVNGNVILLPYTPVGFLWKNQLVEQLPDGTWGPKPGVAQAFSVPLRARIQAWHVALAAALALLVLKSISVQTAVSRR